MGSRTHGIRSQDGWRVGAEWRGVEKKRGWDVTCEVTRILRTIRELYGIVK